MGKLKQEFEIAIVDDYENVAETIATYIRHMGCVPSIFTNPLQFLDELKHREFDILITDIRMPEMDGISLLKKVGVRAPKTHVIVVSAHADKNDAIEALKCGAYDFFEKPVSKVELVATIERTVAYKRVLRERDELAQRLSFVTEKEANRWGIKAFVGVSPLMKEIFSKVLLLQKSKKTNVLVLGESGTGKELLARSIHFGSSSSSNPFVAVNCSAIPADLAESILFGHAKGSFTGATCDRKGQFEMADGGTLFLDEIGDMPPVVQTKLLRVLEDGIVTPVGKADGKSVNVRVISATNTNIEERIASGKFRSDLYHRLAAYEITLPPLRERPEDLRPLIEHFVSLLSGEMGIRAPGIGQGFVDSLKSYSFPGNVRELRNIIERALIDAAGNHLSSGCLNLPSIVASVASSPEPTQVSRVDDDTIPFNLKEAERLLVQRAVDNSAGNVTKACRLLGISRARAYRILG